jgi:hypothetical protein
MDNTILNGATGVENITAGKGTITGTDRHCPLLVASSAKTRFPYLIYISPYFGTDDLTLIHPFHNCGTDDLPLVHPFHNCGTDELPLAHPFHNCGTDDLTLVHPFHNCGTDELPLAHPFHNCGTGDFNRIRPFSQYFINKFTFYLTTKNN